MENNNTENNNTENNIINICEDIDKNCILDIKECPICLENININSSLIILNCCKKKVHIKCCIEWYTQHPNNKNCFMCNQNNNLSKELIKKDNNDTHTIIEINSNQNNNITCKEYLQIFIFSFGIVIIVYFLVCIPIMYNITIL